jgi:hypothetical protein
MRSRKELCYLNMKDLTSDETDALGDLGLNCCDKCQDIDLSTRLRWIDSEEFLDNPIALKLLKEGNTAVCDDCWDSAQKDFYSNPINILKYILDWWGKIIPLPEREILEQKSENEFPYNELVMTIAQVEKSNYREVIVESGKRIEDK